MGTEAVLQEPELTHPDAHDRQTDRTWIAQQVIAALVDPGAFESLYLLFVTPVYRFAYRRLGNPESAADATSQTFIKALTHLDSCDPTQFRSWLFAIAHHTTIDEARRKRPDITIDEVWDLPSTERSPEEQVEATESKESVRSLLAYLTPDQRQIVELRLAGLNGNEIAAALGRSRGSVDTAQSRAISRLRRVFESEKKRSNMTAESSNETA